MVRVTQQLDGFDPGMLSTGFDVVGVGNGDCDPVDGDGMEDVSFMGTTHAGGHSMPATSGVTGMGTSVLLNKCGSMLVRRQSRLEASRRKRNLMERVVSRKDIGTVPLVYLEGVLFPSIFWRLSHSGDGGILGSIPTSLFCQHETRKQYCVASMADHAKTRLKSIGNSAGNNPQYLSFLFDSLANASGKTPCAHKLNTGASVVSRSVTCALSRLTDPRRRNRNESEPPWEEIALTTQARPTPKPAA